MVGCPVSGAVVLLVNERNWHRFFSCAVFFKYKSYIQFFINYLELPFLYYYLVIFMKNALFLTGVAKKNVF